MSNGRKWRRGRVGAAAAAGLGMVVAPMALVGTASAAPTSISAAASNPVAVAAGSTSTGSPTFTVTIPTGSTFAAGDVIAIDVAGQGATPLAAVSFSGTPTVTPTGAGSATAPGFTAVLGHNAADPAADAAVTDEIDLTAAGTGTTTAPVTVTVTGETVTAGSQATTGQKTATAAYKTFGAAPVTTAVTGPFATVTPGLVTSGTPVLLPATGNATLPNVVITEPSAGTLQNVVTIQLTNSTFASRPSVTSSNGTVVTAGPDPTGAATYSFAVAPSTTTTGPTVLTVSGITATETTRSAGNKIDARVYNGPAGTVPATTQLGSTVALGANVVASTIAGPDAQTTAADIYNQSTVLKTGAGSALVLATDYNFPDALSGAYLAGSGHNFGIALSDQNALPPATQQIILTNHPATIYVLGGVVAISQAVVTQIQSLYPAASQPTIVRLGGADQFGTNQQIVDTVNSVPNETLPASPGTTYNDTTGASSTTFIAGQKTAIVASGTSFPDALAASPLSYNDGIPIILTMGDSLSPTASALLSGLGVQQVIMVGGPAAISDAVENQISSAGGLNIPVLRVAGQDATDTAQKIGALEVNSFGFSNATTYVARGDFYTDALAAAPYLSEQNSPIELTETPTVVGPYLPAYLASQGALVHDTLTQFGGPAAITPATQTTLLSDIAAGTTP